MKTFFVSSTFKDMNHERDAIKDITLPILNAEAKKYGQSVSFCDLRWGIDTREMSEEEGSQKVLRVCLDEIDRCRPPLVIILGERYGWIPPSDLVKRAAEYKSLIIDDYEKSVTALEIEYGALSDLRQGEHTLVYMRQLENAPDEYLAEDEEHKKKLDALKERLRKLSNGKIRTYKVRFNGESLEGVDDFATMLASDLSEIMMPHWEEQASLSPFDLDRQIQWDYVEEMASGFKGRAELFSEICADIENGKELTFIKGATGSGKSTLFSAVATHLKEQGWSVLPFIGGYTLQSNDATDIIDNTIYYLENELGKEHKLKPDTARADGTSATDEAQKRLSELCYEYSKTGKRLMIMLDSIERLYPDDVRDKLRFIPENLGRSVRFFMTSSVDFQTVGVDYLTLGSLNDEEISDVIDGIIRQTGRELDRQVVQSIKATPSSKNPLYLSLLVQRLLMMNKDDFFRIRQSGDGMDAISSVQREIIASCPSDVDGLYASLIYEAGKRINESLIIKVTEYIAFSRFGLRESDLQALTGNLWRAVDFAHFLSYMGQSFIMRDDGRFDFSHQSIREGIKNACADKATVYKEIFDRFYSLDSSDEVRCAELLYHAVKAGENRVISDYVTRTNGKTDKESLKEREQDFKTVYDITRADGEKWLLSLISSENDVARASELSDFVSEAILSKFLVRQNDIAAGVTVMQKCREKMKELSGGSKAQRAYLQADLYLSICLLLHDTKSNKDKIEATLTSGIEQCKELYSLEPSKENGELLILFMYVASTYYAGSDVRERVLMAISLFENVIELAKRVTVSNSLVQAEEFSRYSMLSVMYSRLNDKESLSTALTYALKAQQVAREQGKSGSTLISINAQIANLYLAIGGIENVEKALCACKEIYSDMKVISARSGEISDMEALLTARNNYVKALLDSGKEGSLVQALTEALENIKAGELIAAELDTVSAIRPLTLFYMNAASIYNALGGEKNMACAIEMYKKAEGVANIIASRISQSGATLELVSQKMLIAKAYSTANAGDNGDNLLRLVNESIDVLETVKREEPSSQSIVFVELEIYNLATLPYINRAIMTGSYDDVCSAVNSAKRAVECAKILKENDVNGWEMGLANALNNAGFVYRSIYIANKQISEIYTHNVGSEETVEGMWDVLAKRQPIEQVWLGAITENELEEISNSSFTNRITEVALDESLTDEEITARFDALSEEMRELEIRVEKIKDSSRQQALKYYREALEITMDRVAKLQTEDTYQQLSMMYQNLAEIHAYVENEDNLRSALDYQSRAVEIIERQYKLTGADMSRFYLLRAKISLIQIHMLLGEAALAFELIYPVLKDSEELYSTWKLQELKASMDMLYSTFASACSEVPELADPSEATRIFEVYIADLRAQNEAGALADENQLPMALNYYASFIYERQTAPTKCALELAKEAYDMINALPDQDVTSMTVAEQCLINLKRMYEDLNMNDSYEYYEALKETVRVCQEMSEYVTQNEITEQEGEREAREDLLLMAVNEITFSPYLDAQESIEILTSTYYVAKGMLESDNEERVNQGKEFISFVEGALSLIPGGAQALDDLRSFEGEDYAEAQNQEADSTEQDGFDLNTLALLLGIDPSSVSSIEDLISMVDPQILEALYGADPSLFDGDDE